MATVDEKALAPVVYENRPPTGEMSIADIVKYVGLTGTRPCLDVDNKTAGPIYSDQGYN